MRRTKQMKRRHHGRGWMLNKGNRSPLNTNQFIIDRYEFDDNSVDENLNYGSISGKKKFFFSKIFNFLKNFLTKFCEKKL